MLHRPLRALIALAATVGLAACTSVSTTHHRAGEMRGICQPQVVDAAALVMWGAAWREDQKSPGEREIMAERGMRAFFDKGACFQKVDIVSAVRGRSPLTLSDVDMLRWTRAQPGNYGTLIQVRLEELTPRLAIRPSLILWEGGTEVQLRVRVLDVATMRLIADRSLRWSRSGGYALRGTGSLDDDMRAALEEVMLPVGEPTSTR